MEKITHPIVPAIEEFLKIPYKDLALLISGPWGCGKTFFLKNLFKEEWNGKKIIYISLKSFSSLEDISQEIFLQIAMCKLPKNEKISKYLSKFPILKVLKNIDIPYLNTSGLVHCLDKSVVSGIDSEKYIFIFDDLERLSTNLNYRDVLFYIHNLLLEGRSANVIVVTDKDQLFKQFNILPEQYQHVSNKVFYRELSFEQHIQDIFADYLKVRYNKVEKFLYEFLLKTSILQEIFSEDTTRNLRYYNQFFDALVAIWPYFKKTHFFSEEIKQNILNELLVRLWYEYIFLQVTPPSSETAFLYPFTRFSIYPCEYSFVHQFREKGLLNEQQLAQELSGRVRYYIQRAPISEDLNLLNHFSEYSYSQMVSALKSVLKKYPELNDIDLLIDIYACISFLQQVGIITRKIYSKIISSLRKHIKRIVLTSSADDLLSRNNNHLLCRSDKEIQKFWTQLRNEHQKYLEKKYVKLFLQADFNNFELLHYCESATPQQAENLWRQLHTNRALLARRGKLVDCVRFMLKKMPQIIIKEKEATSFIQTYLSKVDTPCEIELLRYWILRFVTQWGTLCYKQYASKLRRRSLYLVKKYNKQNNVC